MTLVVTLNTVSLRAWTSASKPLLTRKKGVSAWGRSVQNDDQSDKNDDDASNETTSDYEEHESTIKVHVRNKQYISALVIEYSDSNDDSNASPLRSVFRCRRPQRKVRPIVVDLAGSNCYHEGDDLPINMLLTSKSEEDTILIT